MERGDISSWASKRIIVVLEGVLTAPRYEQSGVLRKKQELLDPDYWVWEELPVRLVVDYGRRLNVAVEVVTFMGQDVADGAAEWFSKYGVEVTEVERVIDSDPERIQHYGQLGYASLRGERF